jgi:hypothetical protein
VIVTTPDGKQIAGRVIELAVLGPGRANITIETVAVLPCGEYAAVYQTPLGRGIFKVFTSVAYRHRWRASGVLTPPPTQLRFLLIPS